MERSEEEIFITKELEWAKKRLQEKELQMNEAIRFYEEAKLRVKITELAMKDFYDNTN